MADNNFALMSRLTACGPRRSIWTSLDARPRYTPWFISLDFRRFPASSLPRPSRHGTLSFSSNNALSATHRDTRRRLMDIPVQGEQGRYYGNPRNAVFWAILVGNVVVFGAWKYAGAKAVRSLLDFQLIYIFLLYRG